jgi:hypothetical protein
MRKAIIVLLILLIPALLSAQFKNQTKPDISGQIAKPASNILLGFLNPERFSMHHSFSASFMTMGNHSLMVNSYVNTIDYKISDPLLLKLNLGVANMPYNNFADNPGLNDTQFFGGAELRYRPSNSTTISLGIDVSPYYYYGYPYRYGGY